MISRRDILVGALAFGFGAPRGFASEELHENNPLWGIPLARHEDAMRRAIGLAKRNPIAPFGAVITRISDGTILGSGVNSTRRNPVLHGEIAAMNDYVRRNGNRGWNATLLYTTAEP